MQQDDFIDGPVLFHLFRLFGWLREIAEVEVFRSQRMSGRLELAERRRRLVSTRSGRSPFSQMDICRESRRSGNIRRYNAPTVLDLDYIANYDARR